MVEKARTKVIRWTESKEIALDLTLSAGVATVLKELWQLDKDITIRPKSITGSFGISDDPVDESITWFLGVYDPENLPTGEINLASGADWIHNDTWRSIGTDSGPVDTTTERDSVLDGVHSAAEIEDNLAFICVVRSSTTSATRTRAIVEVDIEYRQRRYNNDEFNDQDEEQHALLI